MTHKEEAILYDVLVKHDLGKGVPYRILLDAKKEWFKALTSNTVPTYVAMREDAREHLFDAVDSIREAVSLYAHDADVDDRSLTDVLETAAQCIEELNNWAIKLSAAFKRDF